MGVLEFMVGKKKPTPGEVAKERLKVVLMHDRMKMNPALLEVIKDEIVTVLSRRLEIKEDTMQVNLAHEDGLDTLLANVPILRQKVTFEWDPPSHTSNSSSSVLNGTIRIEGE